MHAVLLATLLAVQEDAPKLDAQTPAKVADWHPLDIQGMTLGFRSVSLGGELDGEEDWNEFWKSGIGFEVKYEYLWKATKAVHAGIYGGFTFDRFAGEEADLSDALGTLLVEHDDMTLFRWVVGGRIRESFKSFFMDQSVGFGFISYPQVDAEITDDFGTFEVGSIEGGTAFTLELAARFGFYIGKVAAIFMSFAYEQNDAPDVHSDISGPGFDYERQQNFAWTLGVNLSF